MIHLRFENSACAPRYMSAHSAAADLCARKPVVIEASDRALVPSGVWITNVDWEKVPSGMIPELQIRARSGLAYKQGIMLVNGIGTIDADYRDEIGVLLYNSGKEPFQVEAGDRIAQICLNFLGRIPGLDGGEAREGGFGSTGL